MCRGIIDLIRFHLRDLTSNLQAYSGGVVLKQLCPTRWTAQTAAIDAILNYYSVLMDTLEEINVTTHGEYGIKAGGFLHSLEKFNTLFGLRLAQFCRASLLGSSEEKHIHSRCTICSGHSKIILPKTMGRR